MDYFKKQKGLIIIIILLAIINIATLVSVWYMKGPEKKRGSFKHKREHIFERRLGLSDEQKVKFEDLRSLHFSEVEPLMKELRKTNKEIVGLMAESENADSMLAIKAKEVASIHEKIELAKFKHFREMRQVCTLEQKVEFDSIMSQMLGRMYDRRGRKKFKKGRP